jgi:hypothetical protein
MIYYGHGGFTFGDLYTMPVYLRNFYYRKMVDVKEKEKEAAEQANKQPAPSSKKIHRPGVTKTPSR